MKKSTFEKIVLGAAVVLITCSVKDTYAKCPDFNSNQVETLQYLHSQGGKEFGYTLATLGFIESSAGMNLVNNVTHDYGILGNNLKTASARLGYDYKNPEHRKYLTKRLIEDRQLNVVLSVEELNHWKKNRSSYESMIRSYNAGKYYKGTKATQYWNKFKKSLHMIQQCVKF